MTLKKLVLALAVVALIASPLAAQQKQGGDLNFATFSDPLFFVPFMSADSASSDVTSLMFSGLLKYDENLKLVPNVAESFTVSADSLTYTFKLRRGVKFHNGQEMTSRDVKVSYDLIRDPTVNSPRRSNYVDVAEILTPDAYTVVFKMSKVNGVFLNNMTPGYIVPADEIQKYDKTKLREADFNRNPIGNGPFKFKEWLTNQRVVLERFDNYFDGPVGFDRYVFLNRGNQATAMVSTERGETNRVMVPESDVARMGTVTSLNLHRYVGNVFDCIVWNTQGEFTSDIRVRQALSHAINKQALVSGIYKGNGRVGVSSYIPGTPFYNAAAPSFNYNIVRAKQLLDEAGWIVGRDGIRVKDGKRMKLFMITNKGNIMREKILQYVQSSFRVVGVEVEAQILEWNTFLTKYVEVGRFDAYVGGFSTGLTADHAAFYHSEATPSGLGFLNRGKYANAEVDRLLVAIKGTADTAKQAEHAFKVQEIVGREVPYTFLINRTQAYAYNKNVRNVVSYDLLGWFNPEKSWVE
jgi:peptide/nickel transport system substrate-binding protein